MKRCTKNIIFLIISTLNFSLFALPFNSKLTQEDIDLLNNRQVVIRNIDYAKNMCLQSENENAQILINKIKNLSPKYLAEVIKIKPYEGNEDLPDKLEDLLLNVSDYAGIPYLSVRNNVYYDLYSSAEILNSTQNGNQTDIEAKLIMEPFGPVMEKINITKDETGVLYISENTNVLVYKEKFDCLGKKELNICIYLFKDNDNWILYGIGGVNAPRIPFLTDRIETSFINRIKTFCNFMFTKLDEN